LLPDDQVHPDTHVLTMVNNVIGVVNYVIAARPSLLNFVIADIMSMSMPSTTRCPIWERMSSGSRSPISSCWKNST